MDDAQFFALPTEDEIVSGRFGLAPLIEEGMPIYRDADGIGWILQELNGEPYRKMVWH